MAEVPQVVIDDVPGGCYKYCELQYKCQNNFEFSIENAETMENCPWKMMILY